MLRRRRTRPRAWPCCSLPARTRRAMICAGSRGHARPWCAAAPAVAAPAARVVGSHAVVAGRGRVAHTATVRSSARCRCPFSPLPCRVSGGARGALHARGPCRQGRAAQGGGARRGVAAAAASALWARRARDDQAGARAQNHDLVARRLLRWGSVELPRSSERPPPLLLRACHQCSLAGRVTQSKYNHLPYCKVWKKSERCQNGGASSHILPSHILP